MKQTAVEWLVSKLPQRMLNYLEEEIEQAKEIEKQQIIDADLNAYINGSRAQAKLMYSEEEVLNILNEFCDNFYENSIRKDIIEKWFNQFKKK